MRIEEYDKEYGVVAAAISAAIESAWKECEDAASKQNNDSRARALKENEAACTVCGKTNYVVKYREVVGKTEGRISGYFSLFGGSISGYVDGETHTNPILSCRECENEKKVVLARVTSACEICLDNMPSVYRSLGSYNQASDWMKEKGIEVCRGLAEKIGLFSYDSQDSRLSSDSELEQCGLVSKHPLPQRPLFYSLRKWLNTK